VELFRQCRKLSGQGYSQDSDEFAWVSLELHRELGLKPWHPFVVDVGSIAEDGDAPGDPSHLRDWLMVRDIRRRLVEAP
jgi:hypothetical protein